MNVFSYFKTIKAPEGASLIQNGRCDLHHTAHVALNYLFLLKHLHGRNSTPHFIPLAIQHSS